MPVAQTSTEQIREKWRRRIRQAQEAQKAFHGTWAMNQAFSAGQQWLMWDTNVRQLRSIKEMDVRYRDRELFTANRIREYVQSALGELSSEDERPELLTAQSGEDAEQIARQLNNLAAYAWDNEWQADNALLRMRRLVLDMGLAAIRCKWDASAGPVTGHQAYGQDGQPITDQSSLEQYGQAPDGMLPTYKPVRQGKTVWEVYSAYQILTPPGVIHEDDFAWEALMRPVSLDEIQDVYQVKLSEDTDIASSVGMPAALSTTSGQQGQNRLRDHAWLFTCFDRPSLSNPQGMTITMGGPNLDLLDVQQGLPYQVGDEYHTGIVYFHWWRLSDRFQSQSFVEPLRDPQRVINRRVTQNVEIIDRGMPKTFVREGDMPETTGAPHEVVEMSRTAAPPTVSPGTGPGQWMYQDIATWDDALSHASTLSPLRLGENPERVETYGQLALLNDNEHGKRASVQAEHNQAKALLVELSMSDVKRYWPDEKMALVEGEDNRIEQVTFKKSDIPPVYRVKVAKGQPLPRTQGAEIKKIDAIKQAMVESGYASALPAETVGWYRDSLEAGEAQDLPKGGQSSQQQLAELENMLMRQGIPVTAAYYDDLNVHVPTHRNEEDQARAEGNAELAAMIEQHNLDHLQKHQMAMAFTGGTPAPPAPAAPPVGQAPAPPGAETPPTGPPPVGPPGQ